MINRWELEEDEDSDMDGVENQNSSPARRNKTATRMSSKNERSKDTSVSSSSTKNNNKNRYSASSTIDFFSDDDDLEVEDLPQGERTSRNPHKSDTLQERSSTKPNINSSKNRSFQPVSVVPPPKPSRNGYYATDREEDQSRPNDDDDEDEKKKEEGKQNLTNKAADFHISDNTRKKEGNEWASQTRAPKVLEVTKSMEQESWHDEEMTKSMTKESWHHEGNDRNKVGKVDTEITYIDDHQEDTTRRPNRSNNAHRSPDSVKKLSPNQKSKNSETWSGKIDSNRNNYEDTAERASRSANLLNSPKNMPKNAPHSQQKFPSNEKSKNSYTIEGHLNHDDDLEDDEDDRNRRGEDHSSISDESKNRVNIIPSPIRVEISKDEREISPLKYSPTAFSKERNPSRHEKGRKEKEKERVVEEEISPRTPIITPRSLKSSPSTSPSLNYDHRNSAKNSRKEQSDYSDKAFIQQNKMKPLESSWETTTGAPQQPYLQEQPLALSAVQGKGGGVRPPRPLSVPLKHHDIAPEKIKGIPNSERGRSYDSKVGEKDILVKRSISWSSAVASNSKPPRPKSTSSVVSSSLASSNQSSDSNTNSTKVYDEDGNVVASHDFDGHVALPPLSEYAIQTGVIVEGWLEKQSTITGFWQKVNQT
jgi:hypothetical protein